MPAPTVPHDTTSSSRGNPPREFTLMAVLLGLLLSIVMGAANVYLGLFAGMTVSASIPAAVVAMGVLRGVMRRDSILESNMVQTAASAGESLAAGIIFTMPALVLLGVWKDFDYWTTSMVALAGGLLGVVLMVPMRRVFVVEDPELKFPEGLACAEVLKAGYAGVGAGVAYVFGGILFGAIFKFAQAFLGLVQAAVQAATMAGGRVFYVGAHVSPALFSVGYIVGLPVAVQVFSGGVIGWLIAIPALGVAGIDPAPAADMAAAIWKAKVRYLGVGAMLVGGIVSIWRVRRGLAAAIRELARAMTRSGESTSLPASERSVAGGTLTLILVAVLALIASVYYGLLHGDIAITALAMLSMLMMSFFFTAVASYIVGLVGNSNSPVSGMTITAVLGTGALIYVAGYSGIEAMVATLGVAGVVCCVACTAGDVCNDLRTGYLVGATPRSQQIIQFLGVAAAAFIMAPVMSMLHASYTIGSRELSAPQAVLFQSLAEGFFGNGQLPFGMVLIGMVIGLVLVVADFVLRSIGAPLRLHVMPVAVGLYLPFELTPPMLLGGLVHYFGTRARTTAGDSRERRGTLLASGMIAGESLVGVLVGFLKSQRISEFSWGQDALSALGFAQQPRDGIMQILALICLLAMPVLLYAAAFGGGQRRR